MKLIDCLFDRFASLETIYLKVGRRWNRTHPNPTESATENIGDALKNKLGYVPDFRPDDRIIITKNSQLYNPYINMAGEKATIKDVFDVSLYVQTDSGGCGNIDIVVAEKLNA